MSPALMSHIFEDFEISCAGCRLRETPCKCDTEARWELSEPPGGHCAVMDRADVRVDRFLNHSFGADLPTSHDHLTNLAALRRSGSLRAYACF